MIYGFTIGLYYCDALLKCRLSCSDIVGSDCHPTNSATVGDENVARLELSTAMSIQKVSFGDLTSVPIMELTISHILAAQEVKS